MVECIPELVMPIENNEGSPTLIRMPDLAARSAIGYLHQAAPITHDVRW